jgi:hypothetical protein
MTATVAASASAASDDTTILYPTREELDSSHEYRVAIDIAYRRTNVLRLSAQYLSEREIE